MSEQPARATTRLELIRIQVGASGAFGVLRWLDLDAPPICVTLERTYKGEHGELFVKIPAGTYELKRCKYNKGGYDTWEITGVAGHKDIKFHAGNTALDSDGCVLTGTSYGYAVGRPAVVESKRAHQRLMDSLRASDRVTLTVRG